MPIVDRVEKTLIFIVSIVLIYCWIHHIPIF